MGQIVTETRDVIDAFLSTQLPVPFNQDLRTPSVSSTRVIGPVGFSQNLLNQKFLGQGLAKQTTTSYRSGRGRPSDDEAEVEEIESASTWAGIAGKMWDQRIRNSSSPHDTGHPFSTTIKYVEDFWTGDYLRNEGQYSYRYSGAVYPLQIVGPVRFYDPDPFDSTYWGTKAISMTAPTKSAASLLTAMIELTREGLPALPGTVLAGSGKPGSYGGEYLNTEFGIKPLISDIKSACKAIINLDRLIAQYERDSSKPIRRSRRFPVERSATMVGTQSGMLVGVLSNHSGIKLWQNSSGTWLDMVEGTQSEARLVERRVEFSGSFIFKSVISERDRKALKDHAAEAIHFLGLEGSLENFWNVQPWTWLLDWQLNLGDIFSNLSYFQSDDLVLRYGYIMCETEIKHICVVTKTTATKSGPSGPFPITYVTRRKERVRANPYGFSTVPGSYSDRQWNILGALGLTRAPKVLR